MDEVKQADSAQLTVLPRWAELPDLELYMDQVLSLIERYLGSDPGFDRRGLTASMVNNYVKLGVKTNIYTACEAAARQREVMIGYRRRDKDTGAVEMVTNPPKTEEIVFEETDGLVVIAVD